MDTINSTEKFYDDLDIRVNLGRINVNIQYLRCMPTNPGWKNLRHCHASYELHFIPYGSGKVILDDKTIDIKPGTFYLTGPGVYHRQISDNETPMVEYCIDFIIIKNNEGFINIPVPKLEMDIISDTLTKTSFWYGEDIYRSSEIFKRIFYELEKKMLGCYLSVSNYLAQVIINSVRCYTNNNSRNYSLPLKTLDQKRENIIGILFNERYSEDLKLEDVAETVCTSRRQAERIISHIYGKTFKQVLNEIRIEKSKQLILDTTMTIEVISQKVGYMSAGYFGKIFKEYTNRTPMEYRKQNCTAK